MANSSKSRMEVRKARDMRLETSDQRLETSDQRLEARGKRLETRDQRLEARDMRLETRDQRLEARDQRLEARDMRLEARGKRLENCFSYDLVVFRRAWVCLLIAFPFSLLSSLSSLNAQGIKDSVFNIEPVAVFVSGNFQKEEAGLKSSELDTLVMRSQLQLDLSDLLSRNTHIHIKDYGRGSLSTASFRGTAPSHTQVSWNGMNINSPMLGMVDFSLIPAFITDGISVQHGAASVADESGGLGGAVQLESRANWQEKLSLKLIQEMGSFGTRNSFIQFNMGSSNFQSKTRLYHQHSDNDYRFQNKNIIEWDPNKEEWYHPVQLNENAAYGKQGLSQEFFYRPNSSWVLSNLSWVQDAGRSIPTVLSNETGALQVQRVNRQDDRSLKNLTRLHYYGEKSSFKAGTGIELQNLEYMLKQDVPGLGERMSVNAHSRLLSWHNNLDYSYQFSDRFSIEARGRYKHHDIQTLDSVLHSGYDTIRNEVSLFAGAYYELSERLHLLFQLREEVIDGLGSPLIYVAGANFRLLEDEDLYLKANVARNFHQPSLNDLYWQPGGNPNLLPEQGTSAEISLQFKGHNENMLVESMTTAYYSDIKNWILWLPGFQGYWEPFNIDRVKAYGVEVNTNWTYVLGETKFMTITNLAWTETREIRDLTSSAWQVASRQLPFIPRLSGNIFLSLHYKDFFIGYRNTSMGRRNILSSNFNGLEDDSESILGIEATSNLQVLYPHYLNYLSAGKTFYTGIGELELSLQIENLFNEEYRNILNRFMPKRSYFLTLKYGFTR